MAKDILERLQAVWRCLRCGCGSCDRSGAGELHDHICTDGEHCGETRERLRARRMAEAITAQDAAAEIRRLRAAALAVSPERVTVSATDEDAGARARAVKAEYLADCDSD